VQGDRRAAKADLIVRKEGRSRPADWRWGGGPEPVTIAICEIFVVTF